LLQSIKYSSHIRNTTFILNIFQSDDYITGYKEKLTLQQNNCIYQGNKKEEHDMAEHVVYVVEMRNAYKS